MLCRDRQKLTHPALQMFLNSPQVLFQQIETGMTPEPESDHVTELLLPVAVVQKQPFAHINDPPGVIAA